MTRTFNVNVVAHFRTIRHFLPDMIKQKKGHIVTIGSLAGMAGSPRLSGGKLGEHRQPQPQSHVLIVVCEGWGGKGDAPLTWLSHQAGRPLPGGLLP